MQTKRAFFLLGVSLGAGLAISARLFAGSAEPSPSPSPNVNPSPIASASPTSVFYPIEDKIPDAKESFYSTRIYKVLKDWPPKYVPETSGEPNPIWVRAIRTKDKPNYIGLVKRVTIKASIEMVAKQIENFDGYKDLFPEIVSLKVKWKENNRLSTVWERDSPAFFIPNIKYEQVYVMDLRSPDKKIYRYQLVTGNSVNNSDGIVVIERIKEGTRLTAWDFFDANWGLARTFAEGTIWRRALEGSYKGDAAFLSKAEHPDWSPKEIEKASEKLLDKFPVDPIQFLENFSLE